MKSIPDMMGSAFSAGASVFDKASNEGWFFYLIGAVIILVLLLIFG